MSTIKLALRGAALATALFAVSAQAALPTTTGEPAGTTSSVLTPIVAAAAEQGPKKDDRRIQLARRGADDPVGHVRHGRGEDDDKKGRHHRGRGSDDRRGDDRGGRRT
jgi:hypothetical protein